MGPEEPCWIWMNLYIPELKILLSQKCLSKEASLTVGKKVMLSSGESSDMYWKSKSSNVFCSFVNFFVPGRYSIEP